MLLLSSLHHPVNLSHVNIMYKVAKKRSILVLAVLTLRVVEIYFFSPLKATWNIVLLQ